ncbi:MAG: insulinase family protein [Thalassotalea sp.]
MIQSPNDKKLYSTITLNNGLRVLLIENQESTKSAAALAVNVGHFSDPKHRQGLAHFLEHMLFLGTKEFPDGSEYQKFISQFGGNHNAWTATEHTCFFFDIQHQQLAAALERFSKFFISPLLSEEFVHKERQNIDAEFKLKLKDDIRRLYDVHKETINPEHPFSQFSVGNIDTLSDRCDNSVRQELEDFFKRYYCAEFMTLAIEGPQPLAELEQLAETYFSPIKQAQKPLEPITQPLYLDSHQQVLINVCPVKNDKQLIISFAMPCIDKYYQDKPEAILAYLLGHEGPGSILSYLKSQHWAFRLTAGSGINGSNFKDFNISIALTEAGEAHIDEIIDAVFSYIKLLNQAPIAEHYFFEKKSIAMLSFNYLEKMKPLDSVSQYVINMQHYPQADYIFGDYMMSAYNQPLVTELLTYLTPKNMRLIQISQNAEFNLTSKWYQVPYSVNNLTDKQLSNWQQASINNALFLPPKNLYIVDNPIIVEQDKSQCLPTIIAQESGLTCWFKQDQIFQVPKGYIYIGIDCPKAVENNKAIAMTRLFIELYSDNVLEENYDAELAGIHYHLYTHQGGVTLQLSGVSEKQPLLLKKLLTSLTKQNFNQNKFDLFKKQLINHWHNADQSKSISQLFSMLSSTLQPKKPSGETLSTTLENISFTEFSQFTQQLFNQVNLELLIHGNWQKSDAELICNDIKQVFAGAYHQDNMVEIGVINNQGYGDKILPMTLPDHDHASVVYYPFADKSIETIATAMVLSQMFSPHFFHEMRTEKQFGYLVGVGYVPVGYYPGLAFYIQSPHTKANELSAAINNFIASSLAMFSNMPEQQWQQLQSGLAGQLQENDASLRIMSQRFWGALCNKDYQFNRKQQLIAVITSLTLDKIILFIKENLAQTEQHDRVTLISIKTAQELSECSAAKIISAEKIQQECPLKV